MPIEFPHVLAACQKHDQSQWEIGDALIRDCGVPGRNEANNDSEQKLERARVELAAYGFEFKFKTLLRYRTIAAAFPLATRVASVPFVVHRVAGTPETLAEIRQRLPEGETLTEARARALKREIRQEGRGRGRGASQAEDSAMNSGAGEDADAPAATTAADAADVPVDDVPVDDDAESIFDEEIDHIEEVKDGVLGNLADGLSSQDRNRSRVDAQYIRNAWQGMIDWLGGISTEPSATTVFYYLVRHYDELDRVFEGRIRNLTEERVISEMADAKSLIDGLQGKHDRLKQHLENLRRSRFRVVI